jgi:hypothetical protein
VIGIDDLEEEESVGKKIFVVDHHVSVRVLGGEKNRGGAVVRLHHWNPENDVVVACDDLFVRGGLLAVIWNESVVLPVVEADGDARMGGLPDRRLLGEVLDYDYVVARPHVPAMVYVVALAKPVVVVVVYCSSRRVGACCRRRDRDCRRGFVASTHFLVMVYAVERPYLRAMGYVEAWVNAIVVAVDRSSSRRAVDGACGPRRWENRDGRRARDARSVQDFPCGRLCFFPEELDVVRRRRTTTRRVCTKVVSRTEDENTHTRNNSSNSGDHRNGFGLVAVAECRFGFLLHGT